MEGGKQESEESPETKTSTWELSVRTIKSHSEVHTRCIITVNLHTIHIYIYIYE